MAVYTFYLAAAMVEIFSDCHSFARAYYDDCIVSSRSKEHCLHINLLKSHI